MKSVITVVLFLVAANAAYTQAAITYTFNGNGAWSDSANWFNKSVPPNLLTAGGAININGQCVLDVPQIILKGAGLIINTGAKLTILANLLYDSLPTPQTGHFEKYTILKGLHNSDKNNFVVIDYQQLSFIVKFDSTAIYQSIKPQNQHDINKLYGFSDNNEQHQRFSARFGWRWKDDSLHLFAYVYNNSVVSEKTLGTVEIGAENNCSIKVNTNTYLFILNGKETTMPRASTTPTAHGYKLYPYFGGDEVAPHDIFIWIKELN